MEAQTTHSSGNDKDWIYTIIESIVRICHENTKLQQKLGLVTDNGLGTLADKEFIRKTIESVLLISQKNMELQDGLDLATRDKDSAIQGSSLLVKDMEQQKTNAELLLEQVQRENKSLAEKMAEMSNQVSRLEVSNKIFQSDKVPWKVYRVLGDHSNGKFVIGLLQHLIKSHKPSDIIHPNALLCVKLNSKPNTGNWIKVGDRTIRLSQIPSGIVVDGVICVIGPKCIINPWILIEEISQLKEAGVKNVSERLIVSGDCPVVTLQHLKEDIQSAHAKGRPDFLKSDGSIACKADDIGCRSCFSSLLTITNWETRKVNALKETYASLFTEDFNKLMGITKPIVDLSRGYVNALRTWIKTAKDTGCPFRGKQTMPLTIVCEDGNGKQALWKQDGQMDIFAELFMQFVDMGSILDTLIYTNFARYQNILVVRAYGAYDGPYREMTAGNHMLNYVSDETKQWRAAVAKAELEFYPADRICTYKYLFLQGVERCIKQCTLQKGDLVVIVDRMEILERLSKTHKKALTHTVVTDTTFQTVGEMERDLVQKFVGYGVLAENIHFSKSDVPDPSFFASDPNF